MTFFWIISAIAMLATFLAISRANAVHALLYLVVSLLAVALLFYDLGAPFAAALEVIIYAGAIMVLFVFVVMMLGLGKASLARERGLVNPRAWIGPSLLSAILIVELVFSLSEMKSATERAPSSAAAAITPTLVGQALYGPYAIAVELASFLLLAGLVAAFHIGGKNDKT